MRRTRDYEPPNTSRVTTETRKGGRGAENVYFYDGQEYPSMAAANRAERRGEEKRIADAAAFKIAEEKRIADEAAEAEEQRIADEEAAAAEEKRIADDAAKIAEEKRIADDAARVAEEKRIADDAAKIAEEKRIADDAARVAEEKRIADDAADTQAKLDAAESAYSGLQDTYKTTMGDLDAAESAYSGLQDTYKTTMGKMGELQADFDNLFSDYSALGTDKSSLQGAYDDMIGEYTSLEDTLATTRDQMAEKNRLYTDTAATLSGLQDDFTGLQGDYTGLQDDFTGLQGDYTGLQGSFADLQTDYGLTSDQLAKSLEDAAGLRQKRQDTQTQGFLQGAEADKKRRMATGTGGIGSSVVPAQAQYTQAMDAMSQTGLNPTSYGMAPIDFTGGMDNNIFAPTQFSAPGADAAAGYTDIFSGPSMGLTQYDYDYGANFNPYFDALDEQYGVATTMGVKQ